MLFLLISLYISRVQSAPFSSISLAPIATEDDITGVAATRTLWNIVYTCLTTTFAITWISMHPNIPNSKKSYFPVLLRLLLAIYALLIPEAIVFWAAVQWKSAKEHTAYFQKKGYANWTMTHSFFLLMGGFTLDFEESKEKYRVIPAHEFKTLVKKKEIIFPDIEEEDLLDKSKGDPLAKGFVILQTLWFVIQILARFAQQLAVTELEVITFALVPLNIATYYFWLQKPLSVKRPIRLQRNLDPTKHTMSPTSLLSHNDSAIAESSKHFPASQTIELRNPSASGRNSVDSYKGRFEKWFRRCIKWVNIWAKETDEMMKPPQRTSSPGPMTSEENLAAPTNVQDSATSPTGAKKKVTKVSVKPVVKVVVAVGNVARRLVRLRRRNALKMSESFDYSSSFASMTKAIIGSLVAVALVVFLAVFAILSISPLLFVALGLMCLAILTAPWVATRAFHAIGKNPDTTKEHNTLPIFYAPDLDKRSTNIMLSVTVVGATIFGGLHVLAWQFKFPTKTEHILWRISSLALTVLPIAYLACHLLTEYVFEDEDDERITDDKNDDTTKAKKRKKNKFIVAISNPARHFIRVWVLVGIPAYTLARLYVLVEAVVALREPQPGTLSAVTWSKFIPHF